MRLPLSSGQMARQQYGLAKLGYGVQAGLVTLSGTGTKLPAAAEHENGMLYSSFVCGLSKSNKMFIPNEMSRLRIVGFKY